MSVLLVSDLHLANRISFNVPVKYPQYPGCNSRFHHIAAAFNHYVDYAVQQHCEAVIVAGDIFHFKGSVDIPVYNAAYRMFHDAAKKIKLVLFTGNHDYTDLKAMHASEGLHSLYVYDSTVKMIDIPDIYETDSLALCIVPYNYSADQTIAASQSLFNDAVRYIKKPTIGIFHHSFAGAVCGPHEFIMEHTLKATDLPAFTHAFCVDEQTEALTPEGWVFQDKLSVDSVIAVVDEKGVFSWEKVQRLNKYPDFYGPMLHLGGDGCAIDHFSTLDHTMFISTKNDTTWRKVTARDMPANSWLRVAASDWQGQFEWQGPLKGSGEDLAAFIGWYISEGGIGKSSSGKYCNVAIAKSRKVKPQQYQDIKNIIENLGFHVSEHSLMLRLCSTEIATWVASEFGVGCQQKKIPKWVKNWPKPLLKLLLQTMILGDGTKISDTCYTYYTTSKQLAMDVQEIAFKLGWGSTLHTRLRLNRKRVWDISIVTKDKRTVRSKYKYKAGSPCVKQYSGLVWCPTVSTGLWVSRRNGRIAVTGNSGHYHKHQTLENKLTYIGAILQQDMGERNYGPGGILLHDDGSWEHVVNDISPKFAVLETSHLEDMGFFNKLDYVTVKWTGSPADIKTIKKEWPAARVEPQPKTLNSSKPRTTIDTTTAIPEQIKQYMLHKLGKFNKEYYDMGLSIYKGTV